MNVTFKRIKIVLIAFVLAFTACEKDNVPTTTGAEGNDLINEFVWSGLNLYYLWQEQVLELDDSRFTTKQQLWEFYDNDLSPADNFESLLYQYKVVDKYSWIVDDYIALENSFQGNSDSNGMEFGLVRYDNDATKLFGYVRYVIPNSDAVAKGVVRGMLFNQINGTQITESNFSDLLGNTSYTISLADYNNGNPQENGTTISLVKSQLTENPIAIAKTIEDGSHKIGYLMYNQFSSNFDGQLNAAFAQFKADNITDLVVDLRYNGGGSVRTATYLGGMITGQFSGQLFSREKWNSKVTNALDNSNFENNFTDQILNRDDDGNIILQEAIQSLNLNKVHFITKSSSASASELVINSLQAYIDVVVVGGQTVGKIYGSATLYDSDNFTRTGDNLSTQHRWAMQPLLLEIVNKNGTNQPNGISPDIAIDEDYSNLGVLGEKTEPMLARTIGFIKTGSRGASNRNFLMEEISNSKLLVPASNNMYSELSKTLN